MVSPPRPKLPGLNSLRTFESAARHESFAEAAVELSVTPGAVAQQIKSLEAWTGKKLFKRLPQGIELTSLGRSVQADFTHAFDVLGEAMVKLKANAVPQEIRIAALPGIAQLWLSPRMPTIRAVLPDILISLTAMETAPMMKRELYDLAVFYRSQPVDDALIDAGDDWIFPVCSPELAVDIKKPEDLMKQVLLHDSTWSDDWKIWFDQFLPDKKLPLSGRAFSLYSLAVEEALNGAGVLIGHSTLVQEQLAAGDLVMPLDQKLNLERSLTIEIADHSVNSHLIQEIVRRLVD